MKKHVPLTLVVAVALVIVAVVGYMVLIRPKRAEVSKLDGEIAALQTQVAAATRLSGSTNEGAVAAIRVADLVKLAKAMPDEEDMAGIILELNAAATGAGVEFASIQPSTPQPGSGYTVIPINLTFQGSYYELTQLLFSLRHLVTVRDGVLDATGRLFSIDAVNFQEGTDGFPQVEATLTVSAYQYGVDPSSLAAAAGTAAAPAETSTTSTTETTPAPAPPPTATQPATTIPAAPTDPNGGVAQGGTP